MAKRFTDNTKWNKHFIRGLQAPYKLLWLFICDECDTSGIWEVDMPVAQIKLGVKLKKETAIASFGNKIMQIDGGKKWFIPGFIEFQYGQLNPQNRAHTKAIFELKKFGLIDDDCNVKGLAKPLTSPLQGAMDMDKEEVMDKEEEEGMVEEGPKLKKETGLTMPFDTEDFLILWTGWKTYKREQHQFAYKSVHTEQAALKELTELAGFNEGIATKIIQQSISNGWKGFFQLRANEQGTTKNGQQQTGGRNLAYKEQLAKRMAGDSSIAFDEPYTGA